MNRPKQKPAPAVETRQKSEARQVSRIYVRYLNAFGIFTKDMLIGVMPFILFIAGIGLLYIANSYYAERTIREIDAVSKELKTLRTEYITGKSELMMICKQSEVARAVAPLGLLEPTEAPKKIVMTGIQKED
jgi:hypothetical protein